MRMEKDQGEAVCQAEHPPWVTQWEQSLLPWDEAGHPLELQWPWDKAVWSAGLADAREEDAIYHCRQGHL